jgi:hypothetical protein
MTIRRLRKFADKREISAALRELEAHYSFLEKQFAALEDIPQEQMIELIKRLLITFSDIELRLSDLEQLFMRSSFIEARTRCANHRVQRAHPFR